MVPTVVLFLLAVVWAVVLLGPKLQNGRSSRSYGRSSRSTGYGFSATSAAALGGITSRIAGIDRSSQRGAARVVPIRPPASVTAGRDAAETFADVHQPTASASRPTADSARARRRQVLVVLSVFSLATLGIAQTATEYPPARGHQILRLSPDGTDIIFELKHFGVAEPNPWTRQCPAAELPKAFDRVLRDLSWNYHPISGPIEGDGSD